ncbi:hypothetical protein RHSIM_Rhsim02G0079600 [Rhododendron simsii]|uniref:FAR1 domain-containing protein n=1 Tax=Rhododendron simsii TaxID=118357 RepID=A0A834LYV7_RHOSS|nr:hypothetical protein RHSIM_Rhsim02G0079600 [Rhododendron simsii]
MRVMTCRRSEIDGKILARRLGCNKEGHCLSTQGTLGSVRKQRESTREGCKAMILVKSDKDGKWVVTKFVKDHNHPLVTAPREVRPAMVRLPEFFLNPLGAAFVCYTYYFWGFDCIYTSANDEKDKKIQELTTEIQGKKRLSALYQDQLTAFMKEVEEHSNQLSKKVQKVVNNLKEFEPLEKELSQLR